MSGWHRRIARIANYVEGYFDSAKSRIGRRLRKSSPVKIFSYRGFGSTQTIYLKGRVLIDKGIQTLETDGRWKNFVNTFKRFNSDEVPGARLRASVYDTHAEITADQEGFFEASIPLQHPLPSDRLWHEIRYELIHAPGFTAGSEQEQGLALVPPMSARFGIISDMDDTVLQTNATSTIRMIGTLLFGNARTRLPFEGVASFYQALQKGADQELNPLFYVSSSPWNLYDLLMEFITLQGIPPGPLFLRDWGVSEEEVLPTGHRSHKLATIKRIMETLQHLPFILIGDSGQEDPEIYNEVVKLYPDRILAIYIRNVSRNPHRSIAIRNLAEEVASAGSTLVLTDDTATAAQHAVTQGWILEQNYLR